MSLPFDATLKPCRIVLVQTQFSGNIGSTARAMGNFGVDDLLLVAPQCDHLDRQARQLATRGENLLERARIVDRLEDAVADCVFVAGTTARVGGLFRRQSVGPPEEILKPLAAALGAGRPAALVFGPETNGLDNEQVARCHALIRIPTSDVNSSLNLAQAVAICLYELQRASDDPRTSNEDDSAGWEQAAPFAEQHEMFARLEAALTRLHFLYGDKAPSLMHALRHLLGRARLTPMEVRLLDGLARQIQWQMDLKGAGDH